MTINRTVPTRGILESPVGKRVGEETGLVVTSCPLRDADQNGDPHICETVVNVSVLEGIPCRDKRSAPLFVPCESPSC